MKSVLTSSGLTKHDTRGPRRRSAVGSARRGRSPRIFARQAWNTSLLRAVTYPVPQFRSCVLTTIYLRRFRNGKR